MSYLKDIVKEKVDLAKIGVDKELWDLLYEVMFLGISRRFFKQADAILRDCYMAQPEDVRTRIGMGMYCLATNDFEHAVAIFKDDLLKENPKNEYAKVHLGWAYKHLKKYDEAKKVLNEVIADKGDQSTIELARALLDDMKAA